MRVEKAIQWEEREKRGTGPSLEAQISEALKKLQTSAPSHNAQLSPTSPVPPARQNNDGRTEE